MVEPEPEIRVPVPQTYLWGKRLVQIIQWFLVFNGPNRSGADSGAKEMLEPGPKNIDAWSRSLRFQFRPHSPVHGQKISK